MLEKIVGSVLVVLAGITFVEPIRAQDTGWRIDQQHSTARLFLRSSKSREAHINVGVARVSGIVDQIGYDAKDSAFDFVIYPADVTVPPLSSGDKGLGGNIPKAATYTLITFKSEHVVPEGGGAFRVTGDLTLMYVERSTAYDPNEAYSGPVYGPAVAHSVKQEAVFEFRWTDASASREPGRAAAEMSASSVIGGEDFPELLNSVSVMDWPAFIADERCVMPSNVGEDFSGPGCTGDLVELTPRPDIHCEMPSTVGESFAGEVCTGNPSQIALSDAAENNTGKHQHKTGAPDELVANEVMIQLDMKLTRTDSVLSGRAGE